MSEIFPETERDAARAAGALLDLCRREREEIGRGSLDLREIQQERERLVPILAATLPAPGSRSAELQGLLDALRREGETNLVLLESLRAEAAGELREIDRTKRASAVYANSARV